jgi:hypothetical protein
MVDLAEFSLQEIINEILDQSLESGMRPPFILCTISPNGSVLIVRVFGDGTAPDVLAEHYENEMFRLPLTLAVIDQDNKAIRGEITASGKRIWH